MGEARRSISAAAACTPGFSLRVGTFLEKFIRTPDVTRRQQLGCDWNVTNWVNQVLSFQLPLRLELLTSLDLCLC